MTIQDYRRQIDIIDDQLLNLLNERAKLAARVGALKAADGRLPRDKGREREVVARAIHTNSGPLDIKAVSNIFRCIINETRRAQTYASDAISSEIKKGS
jgi:chorismate mutase